MNVTLLTKKKISYFILENCLKNLKKISRLRQCFQKTVLKVSHEYSVSYFFFFFKKLPRKYLYLFRQLRKLSFGGFLFRGARFIFQIPFFVKIDHFHSIIKRSVYFFFIISRNWDFHPHLSPRLSVVVWATAWYI